MNLLFDIVTFSKHAEVCNSAHEGAPIDIRTSAGNTHQHAIDENDNEIVQRTRLIKVKFDQNNTAQFVLRRVLSLFKEDRTEAHENG